MQLIPVLDLKAGQAVRAVRGDRATYQPVRSRLVEGSEPQAVAEALLRHTRSPCLYLADLDALTGGLAQVDALRGLLVALPELTLWLDAGFATRAAADELLAALGPEAARITPVFASEALRSRAELEACCADRQGSVLSLDQRHGQPMDRAGCWALPQLWPERVIVMTLDRVGAEAGPDLDTLAAVRRQAPRAHLIGAGGVRQEGDLEAARAAGASAWLVASALHDGRLAAAA